MSGERTWSQLLRSALVLPPIAVGVLILVWQMNADNGAATAPPVERVTPVAAMTVTPQTITPTAIGFGTVEPARTYSATAEVAGTVIARHPQLERGRILPAGTVIFEINPADYDLAIARTRSEIGRLEAEMHRTEVRRSNLERSLELEERGLVLAEDELDRKKRLLRQGNASQSVLDQAENALLTQRDRLLDVRSSLSELDPELEITRANVRVQESMLRQAELDLERTKLRLPFAARVGDVSVEIGQYLQPGTVVAEFDGIDRVEIDAQFALSRVRTLIPRDIPISDLTVEDIRDLPEKIGLEATVRLQEGSVDAVWPATFDRPSDRIDPQTRTVGFIVAVDDPYASVIPGIRPPLTRNMFVEVELSGQPIPGRLIVPIAALRAAPNGQQVYIVDADERLRMRPVEIDAIIGDEVIVSEGLEDGDLVVVSDVQPAVDGMKLDVDMIEPVAPLAATLE